MRSIKTSYAQSKYIGRLPKGCVQCMRGRKLVLFVTGVCHHSCYYCPLSSKRKNVDKTWANEALVSSDEDVVREARLCSSRGVGVTGGEPLARFDRTIKYIRLLKRAFGAKFHVHLYTSGDVLSDKMLRELEDAGLDELRLHLREDLSLIDKCLGHKFDVGAEVPVVPGKEEKLKELILYLEKVGAKFLNLNELEMSELNFSRMTKRGLLSNEDVFNTVRGSYDAGLALLEFARRNTDKLSVHFCTSCVKNVYQYQNRLRLRAKSILKGFERSVDYCMIEKGVVEGDFGKIISELRLTESEFFINRDEMRVEMSVKNARRAKGLGYKCAVVKVMPTSDSFDFEKEVL
ncbi:MAG: radical SAM protein [Candidatus Nanohalarchaeota archaeon]|nr:MAG: radical SAM protein [Candidatus Nanohaloarchaeota archaeon]